MTFEWSALRQFGVILGARYRSPKPESWVQLLVALPSHSGVGCWHPSCALNAAHAGSTPASCSTHQSAARQLPPRRPHDRCLEAVALSPAVEALAASADSAVR